MELGTNFWGGEVSDDHTKVYLNSAMVVEDMTLAAWHESRHIDPDLERNIGPDADPNDPIAKANWDLIYGLEGKVLLGMPSGFQKGAWQTTMFLRAWGFIP